MLAVDPPERVRLRVAVALLGSPLVWFTHQQLSYVLVSLTCTTGTAGNDVLGVDLVRGGVVLLTLAAEAAVAGTGVMAWRMRDRGAPSGEADPERLSGVQHFASLAGVFLAGLSALTILFAGIAALPLDPCRLR